MAKLARQCLSLRFDNQDVAEFFIIIFITRCCGVGDQQRAEADVWATVQDVLVLDGWAIDGAHLNWAVGTCKLGPNKI